MQKKHCVGQLGELVKLSMNCIKTACCFFVKAQWHTPSSAYIAIGKAELFPPLQDQRQPGQNKQAFQPILWGMYSFYQLPHGF